MKMGINKLLAGAVVCLAVASAQAIPITGNVNFSGSAQLNATMGSATGITDFGDSAGNFNNTPTVLWGTGNYGTVPNGTGVAWTPFTFPQNTFGSSVATSVQPLWTFAIGSITYEFDATSISVFQSSTFLNISGAGMAKITGFDDTVGSWYITSTTGGTTFTFQGGTEAIPTSVPDGAVTLILLGLGVSGLALFRRAVASKISSLKLR